MTQKAAQRVELKEEGDVIEVVLPNGRLMTVGLSDIEGDAWPEVQISFDEDYVVNCWLEEPYRPATAVGQPNSLLSRQLDIPVRPGPQSAWVQCGGDPSGESDEVE